MKLLKTLGIASLALVGYAQAASINLKNETDYEIKMTIYAPSNIAFDAVVPPKNEKTKGTGSPCPKYIKFEFYEDGEKLSPDNLALKGDYLTAEGDVWYNFPNNSAGWASISCYNQYFVIQQLKGGAIQFSRET